MSGQVSHVPISDFFAFDILKMDFYGLVVGLKTENRDLWRLNYFKYRQNNCHKIRKVERDKWKLLIKTQAMNY